MQPSVVYAVGSADLRRLIVERPNIAVGAVRALADALRHLVALVEDLSFRHVTARVARILLDQDAAAGDPAQGARRLTQQEMAAMAGTAREMVGRALKELEAAGAIEMRQGHAAVIDAERLRLLA
jgi:CRP/FNR family transcriptional regulator